MEIKFKSRLKELRENKKLNQEELAIIVKITRQQISNMELGKRETSFMNLCKLADFFNVSTDYLLGRTDDDSPFRTNDEG